MDLGGSWAPFGKGLGRFGPSFGHFWALLGSFWGVLNSTFFKHGSAWAQDGLQDASGIDFGTIWKGLGKILGRFEGLGQGFSTTRPLRFCVPRRLGFWGCEQEIAATKTRKTIFCPCSLQRPQQQNVDLLVFVAALSLWLSFPGSLNMARRNARSDPPPHRRWRRVLNFKSYPLS